MEIELADVVYTERVSNAKELAILFPDKSRQIQTPAIEDGTPASLPKSPPRLRHKRDADIVESHTELTRLRSQATRLFKAMQGAVKTRDPVPLNSHMYHDIDGIHLVHRTSWGWRGAVASSRHREFHNVAGAAVLEWNTIEEYRPQLLKAGSGSLYLRYLLLEKLQRILKRSSIFRNKDQFAFADQVVLESLSGEESFPIDGMLAKLKARLSVKSDATIIQNIVKTIERCPLAWGDPENEDGAKMPTIDGCVDKYIRLLAKVCVCAAYFFSVDAGCRPWKQTHTESVMMVKIHWKARDNLTSFFKELVKGRQFQSAGEKSLGARCEVQRTRILMMGPH